MCSHFLPGYAYRRQLKHARSVAAEYVEKAAAAISVTVIVATDADRHTSACEALRGTFERFPRLLSDIVICGVPWSHERIEAVAAAIFPSADAVRFSLARDHGVLFRTSLKDLQALASRVVEDGGCAALSRDSLHVLVSLLIGQR